MRGAEKVAKRRRLKKLIKLHDVCFVAIQEPKLLVSKLNVFAKSIGLGYFCFNTLAERNIWILWDEKVQLNVLIEHAQVLTVELTFMNTEVFWISVVYASCDYVLRRSLWDHLIGVDMPWVVVGDFNSILSSEERNGGAFPSLITMQEFGDFFWITEVCLMEDLVVINIPGVIIGKGM